MRAGEFDEAAVHETPVRLKDRSACYYVNEWYRPRVGADGRRWIETDTGENHDVDDELLEKLRTAQPGLTNNDLVDALAFHGGRLRIVVAGSDGGYEDLVVADEAGEIAVESRSDTRAETGDHGPASEARGCAPTETVIVLRRAGGRTP